MKIGRKTLLRPPPSARTCWVAGHAGIGPTGRAADGRAGRADRGEPRSQRRRPHQRSAAQARAACWSSSASVPASLHSILERRRAATRRNCWLGRYGPSGAVYGQSRPRDPSRPPTPPAAAEGNSNPTATPSPPPGIASHCATAVIRGVGRSRQGVHRAPASRPRRSPLSAGRSTDPVPPELATDRFDLVTLMFNYHDLGHLGIDRAAMNRAVFQALKRGGFYVIADHSGRPGTGISEAGTLHRIEETFLRSQVEAAGFNRLASALKARLAGPAVDQDGSCADQDYRRTSSAAESARIQCCSR